MSVPSRVPVGGTVRLPLACLLAKVGGILGVDRSLLLHSSFLLAAIVLGQVLNFGVQILVARTIGIDSYGIYNYAFAWISLLALVATLGTDQLLIRYASEYRATGSRDALHRIVTRSCSWSLPVSGLLAAAFAVTTLVVVPGTPEHQGVAFWGAAALPALVAAGLVESLLRVHEVHAWATLLSRVLRPLLMGCLFLGLLLLLDGTPDARWAIAANALSVLALLLVGTRVLWPHLPPRPPAAADRAASAAWLRAALPFGVSALAVNLNSQTDTLVLGAFHGGEDLGVYGATSRLVSMMYFASTAVNAMIQPMIVRAVAHGSPGELQQLVRGAARLICLASSGFALVVLPFAEPLLGVFGPGFEQGATALRILCVGYLAASFVNLGGTLLGMTGHQGEVTLVMLGGFGLTLVLNLLLVPRYGVIGAATSTAVSVVLWNLALAALACLRLGFAVTPVALPPVARRVLRRPGRRSLPRRP